LILTFLERAAIERDEMLVMFHPWRYGAIDAPETIKRCFLFLKYHLHREEKAVSDVF
jgi:hypothetical protein